MAYTWTPKRSANGIHEYEGSNGLTLLLVPKEGLGVTTANVTYHVGSRNEGLGLTGATHYLEHGMFKGSVNFHDKKGMWHLEELGAELNATTYLDRTNYFEVIETKHLEECIMREADRMAQPLLPEEGLKKEMTVVRNEYERGENSAFQHLHKRLMATAFVAHPYHHSTIGYKSDIENVSRQALKDFHDKYYTPSNATYTFVGNFDPEAIKQTVAKYFEKIPANEVKDDMYTEEPQQLGERRVAIKKQSRASMLGLGFKAPHGLHRDAIALHVVAHLLTSGTNALSMPLKQKGSVHDVICSWERMKDPYLFVVWATTNYPNKDALETAEKDVLRMLENFALPSEETLETAKTAIKFQWKNEMEGTKNLAMAINEAISRGDHMDVYNRFGVLEDVQREDVLRVAKEYFNRDRMTVATFLPGNTAPMSSLKINYKTPEYDVSPDSLSPPASSELDFGAATTQSSGVTFTKYANTNNTHIMVSLEPKTSSYTAKEYAKRMVLSKTMMKGAVVNSSACPEQAIAKFLSQNGIRRQFSTSVNGVALQLQIPNSDSKVINKMVKLMKAEIEAPILDRTAFTFSRNRLVAEINGTGDDVNTVASTKMYQALFAPGDANYRHDSHQVADALRELVADDIKHEHERIVGNSLTKLTILGPELIRTCSLQTSEAPVKFTRKLNKAAPNVQRFEIPGKTSCTVCMGMVVKPTVDLVVAAGVLGNGFAGRLMKYVRDAKGLTYGIGSKVKRENGTGVLKVVATFSPALLDQGMQASMKVIDEWFTANVTQEEVDVQKQILLGSRNVHFDNPSAIARTVHTASVNGLGIKYVDDFSKKVESVTLASVKAAINALDRNNLKTVIAGTFS